MSATEVEDRSQPEERTRRPQRASTEVRPATAPASRRDLLLPAAAFGLLLASLFGPLAVSGIWDPFELRIAELSRRIALTLLGAKGLAIEGAQNGVPTLGELGRGQLPYTSIALGFKLFGLHEWAGRFPLAVWGLAGGLATYALVRRLADRVAASFSVLALASMPVYFLHARTMLGDIVTMSSLAIATAGLALAVFDAKASAAIRGAWFVVGAVGLAAGFGARGLLLGVATPSLAVGLSWALVRAQSWGGSERTRDVVGGALLALGVVSVIVGVRALFKAADQPGQLSIWVGSAVKPTKMLPTFDAVVHYLGHGLFPWSAVVPVVAGRLFRPPEGATAETIAGETGLRAVAILVTTLALGAQAVLAPVVGVLPYAGVALLAVVAGVALRDFHRGAPGSRGLAMGVAALAVLLYYDFKNFPEKGLAAFVVDDPRFPDSFKEPAHGFLKVATLILLVGFGASVFEQTDEKAPRFDRDEYLAWPRAVTKLWSGNLMFSFLVGEAALLGYAVLSWLSATRFHWKQFDQVGPIGKVVASWGFIALPLVAFVVPALVLVARDVVREVFLRLPLRRATVATLSVALSGSVLSFGYFPKLTRQISPKEVFDSYKLHARPGEALGIVGVGSGAATYYAGRNVPTFENPNLAFNWLSEATDRRWLVVRASDLPQLNSLYRGLPTAPGNVPVLDARSSEILLVSNQLGAGEQNENPFADMVLDRAPNPAMRMDANLGGQLDVVGWEVTDDKGRLVDSVVPQKPYRFRIYYRVTASISGNWETFIHIDGFQRRFNGDHQTLENKYPFHLWRVGDHIVDVYPFSLEPNFTPGDYEVYFGLFIGSRRLEVKRGKHNDNRLEAGRIRVR